MTGDPEGYLWFGLMMLLIPACFLPTILGERNQALLTGIGLLLATVAGLGGIVWKFG